MAKVWIPGRKNSIGNLSIDFIVIWLSSLQVQALAACLPTTCGFLRSLPEHMLTTMNEDRVIGVSNLLGKHVSDHVGSSKEVERGEENEAS